MLLVKRCHRQDAFFQPKIAFSQTKISKPAHRILVFVAYAISDSSDKPAHPCRSYIHSMVIDDSSNQNLDI